VAVEDPMFDLTVDIKSKNLVINLNRTLKPLIRNRDRYNLSTSNLLPVKMGKHFY
jgi:hypothetical protein